MKKSPTATRKPTSTTGATAEWKNEPSSRPRMARTCLTGAPPDRRDRPARPGRPGRRPRRRPVRRRNRSSRLGPLSCSDCSRPPEARTDSTSRGRISTGLPAISTSAPWSVTTTSSTPATAARASATADAVAVPVQDHGADRGVAGSDAGGQARGHLLGDQAALVQDQHPVADGGHLAEDVAGEQHGAAAAEGADQLADLDDLVGIQAAGGLVQHQHLGVAHEGLGQAHALAVAVAEGAHQAAAHVRQAGALHQAGHVAGLARGGHALDLGHEAQHRLDALVGVQGHVLGHEAHLAADGQGLVQQVVAGHDRAEPALGRQRAGEDLHGGGLARAVGAEEAHDLARGDRRRRRRPGPGSRRSGGSVP